MLIKEYLERSKSRLIYPESYYSWQIKVAEKILEKFQDMNVVTEKYNRLVKHESIPNTIILGPVEGDHIVGASILPSDRYITELGNTEKGKPYIKVQTKESKNTFTLIIWFS